MNTAAPEKAGFLKPGLNHPGNPLGSDGLPMGELKRPAIMDPAGAEVLFPP